MHKRILAILAVFFINGFLIAENENLVEVYAEAEYIMSSTNDTHAYADSVVLSMAKIEAVRLYYTKVIAQTVTDQAMVREDIVVAVSEGVIKKTEIIQKGLKDGYTHTIKIKCWVDHDQTVKLTEARAEKMAEKYALDFQPRIKVPDLKFLEKDYFFTVEGVRGDVISRLKRSKAYYQKALNTRYFDDKVFLIAEAIKQNPMSGGHSGLYHRYLDKPDTPIRLYEGKIYDVVIPTAQTTPHVLSADEVEKNNVIDSYVEAGISRHDELVENIESFPDKFQLNEFSKDMLTTYGTVEGDVNKLPNGKVNLMESVYREYLFELKYKDKSQSWKKDIFESIGKISGFICIFSAPFLDGCQPYNTRKKATIIAVASSSVCLTSIYFHIEKKSVKFVWRF